MCKRLKERVFLFILLPLLVSGCVSVPKGFLKIPEDHLEKRILQSRQYDSKDTGEILSAAAGVLQDMGFTIEESETEIGLIVGSRKCDASDGAQVAGALFIDLVCAFGGTYSNASANVDAVQDVRAAVVVKPSLNDKDKTAVRVNFQRVVWSVSNEINRLETLTDPEMYGTFYEKLSKSVFLEAQEL